MPYYIGDVIKDYKRLVIRTPEEFKKTGIDVRLKTRVDSIDAGKGVVQLSDKTTLPYDILVLATGAHPVRLEIPGNDIEGVFVMRNLTDSLRMKEYINHKKCRKAVVVGAGYIGLEMCEALRGIGIEATVITRHSISTRWHPEFADMIVEELEKNKVRFMPETFPLSIERGNDRLLKIITNNGVLDADLVLMAVGISYNTGLAEGIGLELGKSGAIKVDPHQRTSREGIYAAGDCAESFHRVAKQWVYFPLGDIANKQGRVAGQNIGGHRVEFPGIVGSQCFKCFGLEVGSTGLTEDEAKKYGFDPVSAMIWGLPMARPMSRGEKLGIKLVADRTSGKLLGGQAIGEKGAVQRINSLAVALFAEMSIDDVGYLDLAYAPPFGGAWDPVHITARNLKAKIDNEAKGASK